MNHRRTLIWAAKVADATEVNAAPGAILIEGDQIIATGRPEDIGQPADAALLDCRDYLVIPGLVNVHAHLDLTHIGPVDFDGQFTNWVSLVRRRRARSPQEIANSVASGVELSRAGGTVMIGDIAGNRSLEPLNVLRRARMAGINFLEVFGLGRSQADTVNYLRQVATEVEPRCDGVRFGLQPHAPYSCGLEVYRAAAELGLPLATHIAETHDELEFVANATGPLRDMLMGIGVWDDTIVGYGKHPLDALETVWNSRPWVVAHLNYIEDQHLAMLARWPITVAFCPRASAYFGHEGHRYRQIMDAGANVALGTDSLLCLDTPSRISVLDEMRLLYQRDGTDPHVLLRMATVNGATALGFDPQLVTLRAPGRTAGVIGIRIDPSNHTDPLIQALTNDEPPQWIMGPVQAEDAWMWT